MDDNSNFNVISGIEYNSDFDTHSDYLVESFRQIGISLNDVQIHQFVTYYELLTERNKVMNLTAITSFEDVVQKHFIDSILVTYSNFFQSLVSSVHSVIDVGTGAGFPGIPLKILYPDWHVILLDSLNKRVAFLDEVIEKLNLTDTTAIHSRAEDAARNSLYRESFDLCVSRAVANLSSLLEYCLPFVRSDGYFISYKSASVDDEVVRAGNACLLLGGETVNIEKTCLPGTQTGRSFVYIKKIRNTSAKYPRKAGIPSRNPLT